MKGRGLWNNDQLKAQTAQQEHMNPSAFDQRGLPEHSDPSRHTYLIEDPLVKSTHRHTLSVIPVTGEQEKVVIKIHFSEPVRMVSFED